MISSDIIRMRLENQQLLCPSFTNPVDVVQWLGAVQSQDYAGGKWALANRSLNVTEDLIDKLFDSGSILRTHVLRPTWHFVLPSDIRWMVELTEPRITALSAKQFRDLELDKTILNRSNRIIEKALSTAKFLTKKELAEVFKKARIDTTELRLTFFLIRAELDRLICSGPRRGKQFTYALLDYRAPESSSLKKDEALNELGIRYFKSRGPATVRDFGWWSGLSPADARRAVEIVKPKLQQTTLDDQTFYFIPSVHKPANKKMQVHLLSSWDEYTVAYKDRSLVIDSEFISEAGHGIFNPIIVVKGKIKGTWRREIKSNSVLVDTKYFGNPDKALRQKVLATAEIYATYLGRTLV
jgi:hypothetical protein